MIKTTDQRRRCSAIRWPNRNGSLEDHVMAFEALNPACATGQDSSEQWLDIEGWPGYEVSDFGRVRSWKQRGKIRRTWVIDRAVPPRILRHDIRNGYPSVLLVSTENGRAWKSVHRLVLGAFIGQMPSTVHAAHGDGDKTNNRLTNLRWASPAENNADKANHGTRQNGEKAGTAKLTWEAVAEIRSRRASGEGLVAVARRFGVCVNTITSITSFKTWVPDGA